MYENKVGGRESGGQSIGEKISAIRDRIAHSSALGRAAREGEVISSLGSETPLSVLMDIRSAVLDVRESLRQAAEETEYQNKRADERHQELCTVLLSIASNPVATPGLALDSRGLSLHAPRPAIKTKWYFGPVCITSGTHVVGCIMMHLDKMMSSHHALTAVAKMDTTFLDVKDWCNLAQYLLNADRKSKGLLRIPKPADDDFKTVCSHLASEMEGRRPACDETQIHGLLSRCPEVMHTVEWTRNSIIKCKGVLSPHREFKWKCISHPFVNDNAELNLAVPAKKVISKRQMYERVSSLKVTGLKRYMELVLVSSFPPPQAITQVERE